MTYTYNESGVAYNQTGVTYDGDTALGLSNLPVVGVFVAFDDGPYVADPDWVEVTDYVRDVSIRRGRQDDLQQFPSGSCSITFDNRDRLFDPFNTAGAYYGKLKPRRQVRVVGQWNGVNYPLFRGFVAGWPVEFTEGGKDSTVTVDCFDLLGLLSTEVLPVDWVYDYTLSLGPECYWRFDESQPVTTIVDEIQNITFKPLSASDQAFETVALATGLKSSALFVNIWYAVPPVTEFTDTFSRCMAGWIKFSPTSFPQDSQIIYRVGGGTIISLELQNDNTTIWLYVYKTSGGTQYFRQYVVVPPTTATGNPFHFAVNVQDNGAAYPTVTLYINAVEIALTINAQSTDASPTRSRQATIYYVALQELLMFKRLLTPEEISNLYNYSEARINESTSARFFRVLGETSIPSVLDTFEGTSAATVSRIGDTRSGLLEIQKAVTSEGGELFVTREGVVTFVARDYWASRSRSNTSQMSFTDTGAGVYYDAGSLRMNLDADLIRNDVNVTFGSGGAVSSTDIDSVAEYGAANVSLDTYLVSPDQAKSLADEVVSIYKNPKLRVEPFLVKGQRNPSYDWPRLLNLELLDRFTFVRTPSVGSAIQRDMLLQSIEHRITPGTWETTINGSARYTGWFILGVSLLGSTEDVLL